MTKNISNRDWEKISAYLDGQLSGRKLTRFESRLSQEHELRAALDELHHTRQVLRNAPLMRVPRNFLLTHQMVGRPRHLPRLAPAFGWTSAVASLLLVLLLVGDFFSSAGVIPTAWNNVPRQVVPMAQEIAEDSANVDPAAMDAPGLGGASEAESSDVNLGATPREIEVTPEFESVAAAAVAPEEVEEATEQLPPEGETASELLEGEDVMALEIPSEAEPASPKVLTDTVQLGEGEEFLSVSLAPTQTITAELTLEEDSLTAVPESMVEPTATEIAMAEGRHVEKTPTIPVVGAFPDEFFLPTEEPSQAEEQLLAALPAPTVEQVAKIAPEIEAEAYIAEEQVPEDGIAQMPGADESSADFLVGLEVGVILLVLSTAIVWIYLRRRGG